MVDQFLILILSSANFYFYSLQMTAAAAKIRQQLDEVGRRVHRVSQEWEERERLLSLCIQGHALLMDCRKV